MALTLAEAAKLSNDMLMQGVVETIVKDSPVLQRLPFIEIVGNGLTYNQENTLPNIDFYDVGDTWNESTPTFTQLTANLKIMGGDADVDNFLKATRSNIQDLEAAVIELKAKALQSKFEEMFIYGNTATSSKQFDGLKKLINTGVAGTQVIAMGAAGATLTLAKLDELIDAVKGGKPDMLFMSRRSRRKINALVRDAGGHDRDRPRPVRELRAAVGQRAYRRERLDTRYACGRWRGGNSHNRRGLFYYLRRAVRGGGALRADQPGAPAGGTGGGAGR